MEDVIKSVNGIKKEKLSHPKYELFFLFPHFGHSQFISPPESIISGGK
jgi:hypothetical protein